MKNFKSSPKSEIPKASKSLLEYNIQATIGEGTYGKVKYATHILTNQPVAIKFINKNRLLRPGDTERIQNEMKVMTELNHPNILKAYEIFEDESYYYIVMERAEKGDLFNYIGQKGRLTLDEATFIYYQLVNAISYLQKNNISHRDLKPENLLITDEMIIKIGDFGLSKIYKSNTVRLSTICGSPCYSAPEMLRGNRYKPLPIDVWGIGVILYCMVCGALPFEDKKEDELIRKVIQCDYNCPFYVNPKVRALFRQILTPNPNDRISMQEIKTNFVYNMGKANFSKRFKIYGDNGELLPQVERFIKEKTINYLETECSMEIHDNIETSTPYKIFFHSIMYKTQWDMYHIPKNDEQNVEQIEVREEKTKIVKSVSDIKTDEKEEEINEDILFVPPHESISYAISKSYEENNEFKVNFSDEDIDAMRRLGILSHSFDVEFISKLYNISSNDNLNCNYNENYIIYNDNKMGNKGSKSQLSGTDIMSSTFAGSKKVLKQESYITLDNKMK